VEAIFDRNIDASTVAALASVKVIDTSEPPSLASSSFDFDVINPADMKITIEAGTGIYAGISVSTVSFVFDDGRNAVLLTESVLYVTDNETITIVALAFFPYDAVDEFELSVFFVNDLTGLEHTASAAINIIDTSMPPSIFPTSTVFDLYWDPVPNLTFEVDEWGSGNLEATSIASVTLFDVTSAEVVDAVTFSALDGEIIVYGAAFTDALEGQIYTLEVMFNNYIPKTALIEIIDTTPEAIDSFVLQVDAPVTGEKPSEPVVSDINEDELKIDGFDWAPDDDPFEPGVQYSLNVTVTALEGYTFPATLTSDMALIALAVGFATITAFEILESGTAENSVLLTATFIPTGARIINNVDVEIDAPVTGGPADNPVFTNGVDGFEFALEWRTSEGALVVGDFEANTIYTLFATLTALPLHMFNEFIADNLITVSGLNPSESDVIGGSTVGNKLVFTVEFEKTDDTPPVLAISELDLSIIPPVTGEVPAMEYTVATDYVEAGDLVWGPGHARFAADTVYTVWTTVTALEGHVFAEAFTSQTVLLFGYPSSLFATDVTALVNEAATEVALKIVFDVTEAARTAWALYSRNEDGISSTTIGTFVFNLTRGFHVDDLADHTRVFEIRNEGNQPISNFRINIANLESGATIAANANTNNFTFAVTTDEEMPPNTAFQTAAAGTARSTLSIPSTATPITRIDAGESLYVWVRPANNRTGHTAVALSEVFVRIMPLNATTVLPGKIDASRETIAASFRVNTDAQVEVVPPEDIGVIYWDAAAESYKSVTYNNDGTVAFDAITPEGEIVFENKGNIAIRNATLTFENIVENNGFPINFHFNISIDDMELSEGNGWINVATPTTVPRFLANARTIRITQPIPAGARLVVNAVLRDGVTGRGEQNLTVSLAGDRAPATIPNPLLNNTSRIGRTTPITATVIGRPSAPRVISTNPSRLAPVSASIDEMNITFDMPMSLEAGQIRFYGTDHTLTYNIATSGSFDPLGMNRIINIDLANPCFATGDYSIANGLNLRDDDRYRVTIYNFESAIGTPAAEPYSFVLETRAQNNDASLRRIEIRGMRANINIDGDITKHELALNHVGLDTISEDDFIDSVTVFPTVDGIARLISGDNEYPVTVSALNLTTTNSVWSFYVRPDVGETPVKHELTITRDVRTVVVSEGSPRYIDYEEETIFLGRGGFTGDAPSRANNFEDTRTFEGTGLWYAITNSPTAAAPPLSAFRQLTNANGLLSLTDSLNLGTTYNNTRVLWVFEFTPPKNTQNFRGGVNLVNVVMNEGLPRPTLDDIEKQSVRIPLVRYTPSSPLNSIENWHYNYAAPPTVPVTPIIAVQARSIVLNEYYDGRTWEIRSADRVLLPINAPTQLHTNVNVIARGTGAGMVNDNLVQFNAGARTFNPHITSPFAAPTTANAGLRTILAGNAARTVHIRLVGSQEERRFASHLAPLAIAAENTRTAISGMTALNIVDYAGTGVLDADDRKYNVSRGDWNQLEWAANVNSTLLRWDLPNDGFDYQYALRPSGTGTGTWNANLLANAQRIADDWVTITNGALLPEDLFNYSDVAGAPRTQFFIRRVLRGADGFGGIGRDFSDASAGLTIAAPRAALATPARNVNTVSMQITGHTTSQEYIVLDRPFTLAETSFVTNNRNLTGVVVPWTRVPGNHIPIQAEWLTMDSGVYIYVRHAATGTLSAGQVNRINANNRYAINVPSALNNANIRAQIDLFDKLCVNERDEMVQGLFSFDPATGHLARKTSAPVRALALGYTATNAIDFSNNGEFWIALGTTARNNTDLRPYLQFDRNDEAVVWVRLRGSGSGANAIPATVPFQVRINVRSTTVNYANAPIR
jgi:hypothetical protein